MTNRTWVGITVKTAMEAEEWFGELECTLEEFFGLPETAFVRLNHARWLEAQNEYEEPNLVRNQDGDPPFEHYLFVRKADICMMRPLRVGLHMSEDHE